MKNETKFGAGKKLDLICLGRAGVDLYANQIGSRLEDVASFNKYIGGSSTNIAFGTARLGLKSSMLTRVGDEHMGRFIRESLLKEGCDVSHVITDPDRLTALVILGIKDRETFPLIFYRENCADMKIYEDDFDESYIASAKAFLITGTHLSTEHTKKVALKALDLARRNDTRTVLDIDYRPVLWGLTGKGDGETRFVSSSSVTEHLQSIVSYFDLIVGTEEEFFIAGGSQDIIRCLRDLRKLTDAVFVVKRGPYGCSVFNDEIPNDINSGFSVKGVTVEVLNVLGAGDAFMSGFLKGWLRGENYKDCCSYANACGALVVSRHACSPSMPTQKELEYYLSNADKISEPDRDETLNRLHRQTSPKKAWKELCIFAFDHREQIAKLVKNEGGKEEQIPEIKNLMLRAFRICAEKMPKHFSPGVLIDEFYGKNALNEITGEDFWIASPVELPFSRPIRFQGYGSLGSTLISRPTEHIVKCLVYYHPDDKPDMLSFQQDRIRELYQSCVVSGHELLLELILPPELFSDDETIIRAVRQIYDIGVYPDWWKLAVQPLEIWRKLEQLIREYDKYCRGIVILGLDAPIENFEEQFKGLREIKTIKGFAIGRTIFKEPLKAYLRNKNESEFMKKLEENLKKLIGFWDNR